MNTWFRRLRWGSAVSALAVALGVGVPGISQAVPTLTITGTGAATTITEVANSLGLVTYSGAVGTTFTSTNITGLGLPLLGSPGQPQLQLTSVQTTSEGPGTLTIMLSDQNYQGAASLERFAMTVGGTMYATGTGATISNSQIQFLAYADTSNTLNGTSTLLASTTLSGMSFSDTKYANLPLTPTVPYSLTLEAIVTHDSPAGSTENSSFSQHLETVPEPGTLVLLGIGLLGLGLGTLARRRSFAPIA